jgi:hypothetical protein
LADETNAYTKLLGLRVGERNDADANLVYTDGPACRRGSSLINDTVIAGLMIGIAGALRFRLMPMHREREKPVRDINVPLGGG